MNRLKNIYFWVIIAAVVAMVLGTSCKNAITDPSNATGKAYELIITVDQQLWDGELGDTLRSIFMEPVGMLNQTEPLFDVLRINPAGLTGFIRQHRNIVIVNIDKEKSEPASYAMYDTYSKPQIIVTVSAPTATSMAAYLSENRAELQELFESTERSRSVALNSRAKERMLSGEVTKMFGIRMDVPRGYTERARSGDDFLWLSNEQAASSQGIVIYKYPYSGNEDFLTENIIKRRTEFTSKIPGPSAGSYMITGLVVEPEVKYMTIYGRQWVEMRGFWDVENDFMGGPFVNYTTLDAVNNQIISIDYYVFSPRNPKRNLLRSLEHTVYSVQFPPFED